MNFKLILAHVAMFIVAFIYAANFTLAKIAMPEYIRPLGFILLRACAGTVLFWLSSLVIREKVPLKDLGMLALCGLFGVAINQMFFFTGLELTTPINGALIMLTTPILVLFFSILALREKLTIWKVGGIALGLGGAALLILSKSGTGTATAPNPMLGNLFVAINAASYGIYLILVKPYTQKYHPITLLKWVFGFGLLYVFPFGMEQAAAIDWNSFTPEVWWVLVFVLFCVTFLAYLLNAAALTLVQPSIVSAYIYLQPLLAAVIAVTMGQDQVNIELLAAGLLIFTGVFLVSMKRNEKEYEKK